MARGMASPVMGSFNEPDDNTVARISAESIEQAILDIGSTAECDAVFVACTSLRVARIVERVEQKHGKTVTSSNHALASHMLRLGGVADDHPGKRESLRRPLYTTPPTRQRGVTRKGESAGVILGGHR